MLPTGKNIHALDPQSIPTAAALKNARVVVDRLLERQKDEAGGKYPESIAVVLWGTDNIKTYGESLAQVRRGRGRGVAAAGGHAWAGMPGGQGVEQPPPLPTTPPTAPSPAPLPRARCA